MNDLIEKYKSKITELQKKRDFHERQGRAGACLSITGEINAYNAVLSDLRAGQKMKHPKGQ